jgi:hypothetical protein
MLSLSNPPINGPEYSELHGGQNLLGIHIAQANFVSKKTGNRENITRDNIIFIDVGFKKSFQFI